MKVWITKYALTKGIFEANGCVDPEFPNMVTVDKPAHLAKHYHGKDWHTTHESAQERARLMREHKIKQHFSAIDRLVKMMF